MQMNNETSTENTPQEELNIGDLLRTEREKRGISQSRLAEIIKVREHVIDALEKEEWDKLPARVFIKGFIRSYTIAIGYDTKKALKLFDINLPSKGNDSPVPLAGKTKKNWTMYYAVPILIILAVVVYLFAGKDKVENNIEPIPTVSETPPPSTEIVTDVSLKDQVKATGAQGQVKTEPVKEPEINQKTVTVPEKKTEEHREPAQSIEKEPEEIIEFAPAEETVNKANITDEEESAPEPESAYADSSAPMLTLSATVNERTYIKIITDDNPPKEFIFQPGKTPQWTAERGFEVTVGNAAGIEFEFNGETFKNLGREGRVKTIRFPKDFKTAWEEE